MGHGWASDVALSNIHERYSLTSPFLLYKNKKASIITIIMHLSPTSKLGYLSFKFEAEYHKILDGTNDLQNPNK